MRPLYLVKIRMKQLFFRLDMHKYFGNSVDLCEHTVFNFIRNLVYRPDGYVSIHNGVQIDVVPEADLATKHFSSPIPPGTLTLVASLPQSRSNDLLSPVEN